MLKNVNSKKMAAPFDKVRAAAYLEGQYRTSEPRACQVLTLNRNTKPGVLAGSRVGSIAENVVSLAEAHARWGYRKVYDRPHGSLGAITPNMCLHLWNQKQRQE